MLWVYVCVCTHRCIWRLLVSFLLRHYPPFLTQGVSLAWSSPIQLGWLAIWAYLCFPLLVLKSCTVTPDSFIWDQTWVLMLARQRTLPTELSLSTDLSVLLVLSETDTSFWSHSACFAFPPSVNENSCWFIGFGVIEVPWIFAILVGIWWYFVILIGFLMTYDAEHLFITHGIDITLRYLFRSFANF